MNRICVLKYNRLFPYQASDGYFYISQIDSPDFLDLIINREWEPE